VGPVTPRESGDNDEVVLCRLALDDVQQQLDGVLVVVEVVKRQILDAERLVMLVPGQVVVDKIRLESLGQDRSPVPLKKVAVAR